MTLRVIGGSARGRRLKRVPGDATRPIMDRVKEALFSILGQSIIGAQFLDLYAGTGSVGIEALSRGAAKAVFYDLERRAIQTIRENLEVTRLAERGIVHQGDALALLRRPPQLAFDFIFIAPPQYKELWRKTLEALDANPLWLPAGTEVIVQIDPKEVTACSFQHLVEYDQRRYGNTLLWFFEAVEPASPSPPPEPAEEDHAES